MRKYLVVFEAPCVGTNEELVQFETDREVSDWAWEKSVTTREYIAGSYDIYQLVYDHNWNTHQLVPVDEIAIWEAEAQ